MFDFLKSKDSDIIEALTNQTIGGQAYLAKVFKDCFGLEPSKLRRLELYYFATSVMTYVYLRTGKQSNREEILDKYTRKVLEKGLFATNEDIRFSAVIKEYQDRYHDYSSFINMIFNSKSGDENFACTLLTHAFEYITQSSASDDMIHILAATGIVHEYILDHLDFVKEKL